MQGDQVFSDDAETNSSNSAPPESGGRPGTSWITNKKLRVSLIWAASIATALALWPVIFNLLEIERFIFLFHVDSEVYRAGAQAFLDGLNLYTRDYAIGSIQL